VAALEGPKEDTKNKQVSAVPDVSRDESIQASKEESRLSSFMNSQDRDILKDLDEIQLGGMDSVDPIEEEDNSPKIFISESTQKIDEIEKKFDPVFEVQIVRGNGDEPSSILSLSDMIILSMEKEEEKVIDKNKQMKRKSYGNEAQILHDANKDSVPVEKVPIKELEKEWINAMENEP